MLNGAGEVAGLTQVVEWGLLETPILLTNTHVGGQGLRRRRQLDVEQHPGIGDEHDVIIPVVGECDDSFLNDVGRAAHPRRARATRAIETRQRGPVAEGSVGAGTGMITCDFKAGIGTSSRKLARETSAATPSACW